jgi:hypothetical protein
MNQSVTDFCFAGFIALSYKLEHDNSRVYCKKERAFVPRQSDKTAMETGRTESRAEHWHFWQPQSVMKPEVKAAQTIDIHASATTFMSKESRQLQISISNNTFTKAIFRHPALPDWLETRQESVSRVPLEKIATR